MSTNNYLIGNAVRVSCVFTDGAGIIGDPAAVTLIVREPGAEDNAIHALDGGLLKKVAIGRYSADIYANKPGSWLYRFEGTGGLTAAEDGSFTVIDSILKKV
jgi:hypothetical protein